VIGTNSTPNCTDWTLSDWIITSGDNTTIQPSGGFSSGCYKLNTKKACSTVQIHTGSGSGLVNINGTNFNCEDKNSAEITAQSKIELAVSGTCLVSYLYVSDCETVLASEGEPIGHGSTLSAGTYTISGWNESWCGSPENIKVQSGEVAIDCLDWITGTNKSYTKNDGTDWCKGSIDVTYPLYVTVPENHTLTLFCM